MSSLRQLEVFRAVANSLSFTRAAEELHISQPVVSRIIREFERSLGADLFQRTTRSVTLTPEGQALLAIAEELLQRHYAALTRFAQYCRGERGRIVVAALPSIAASALPPVLAQLVATYPDISVEILDVPAAEAIHEIEVGHADLAIAEPPPSAPGLKAHFAFRDRFVGVLPQQHRLGQSASLTWRDLASEPFVAISPGSSVRRLTDIAMAQAHASPTAIVEARNIATAGGIIAAGLGVSAFPEMALPLLQHAPVTTMPLTGPALYRDIAVLTPRDGPVPPAARLLIEILRDTLA